MRSKAQQQRQKREQGQEQRLRAQLIVQVRSGVLTAAAASRRLGVSRKTYYKWEQRGLAGLLKALEPRRGGRSPNLPDEERARLKRENAQLQRQLLLARQRLAIQDAVSQTKHDGGCPSGETKKKERAPDDDR
jgi:transposase